MRLTVSQYLARLTDCTTNMFWGDASLGDTSLIAGASSPASCYFEQLSVGPENGEDSRQSQSQWVEEGGQDQVGGWSQRRGGEECGVSRRGMLSRKDDDGQPRDPSFYRPCGAGGGDDPKRCRHLNRVLWLGPGQHTGWLP